MLEVSVFCITVAGYLALVALPLAIISLGAYCLLWRS